MLSAQKYGKNLHVNYSPFGAILYGRNWSSEKYRYGFNGMEKDDEIKGSGNSYDFGARMYDSRLGRFLSIDRSTSDFPWISPYSYAENQVIIGIDNGDSLVVTTKYLWMAAQFQIWLEEGLEGQYDLLATITDVPQGYEIRFQLVAKTVDSYNNLRDRGKTMFVVLNGVLADENVISKIELVSDDEKVDLGSYGQQKVDIGDIRIVEAEGKSMPPFTYGILMHEISEQYFKASRGLLKGQYDYESYNTDHEKAIKIEEMTGGYQRYKGLFAPYKYFYEYNEELYQAKEDFSSNPIKAFKKKSPSDLRLKDLPLTPSRQNSNDNESE